MHTDESSYRYRVLAVLGEGGWGTVYRARLEGPEGFSREVALKLLKDDDPPEAALRRLRDEARILGLVRDRAVVGAEPPIRLGGRWAVVMELVEGASLRAVLKRGPVPPRVALEIVEEVARALHNVAQQVGPNGERLGVIHRDLKPSNLQITAAGDIKLLDFGIARADFKNRESTTTAHIGGTIGYIAPERLRGIETAAGDIYSLGVILHELILGERPGEEKSPVSPATMDLERLDTEELESRTPLGGAATTAEMRACLELSHGMRRSSPEDRPTAEEVEQRSHEIAARMLPPRLRTWAAATIPTMPQVPPDGMVGEVLTRSLSIAHTMDGSGTFLRRRPSTGALGIAVAVALAAMLLLLGLWLRVPAPPAPATLDPDSFGVLVAPFWGPDEASRREGDVMGALVEQKVMEAFSGVAGTRVVVGGGALPRSEDDARRAGTVAGADLVVWGEAIAYAGEVAIEPRLTLVVEVEAPPAHPDSLRLEGGAAAHLGDRRAKAGEVGAVALLMAGVALTDTDPALAATLLERILPPTPASLEARAAVHRELGERDQGERLLRAAVTLAPEDAQARSALSMFYGDLGRFDEAVKEAEAFARLRPSADALTTLGWTLCGAHDHARALEAFTRALEDEPQNVTARLGLGYALYGIGEMDDAKRAFGVAIALEPDVAWAHNNLGWAHYRSGDLDAAAEAFGVAVQLQPDRVYWRLQRSIAQMAAGRGEAGRAELADGLAATSADPWMQTIARFYVGDIDEVALLAASEAPEGFTGTEVRHDVDRDTRRSDAHYYVGMFRLLEGRRDEAAAHFEQVRATNRRTFVEAHRAREELAALRDGP